MRVISETYSQGLLTSRVIYEYDSPPTVADAVRVAEDAPQDGSNVVAGPWPAGEWEAFKGKLP